MTRRLTRAFFAVSIAGAIVGAGISTDRTPPDPRPAAAAQACFTEHLRDAVRLNTSRAGAYEAIGEPEAAALLRRLAWMERALLPIAWYVDRRDRALAREGVGLTCEIFVSMEGAPAFRGRIRADTRPRPDVVVPSDLGAVLRDALAGGGLAALADGAEGAHDALARRPRYAPLTRHLLASLARTARVLGRRTSEAAAHGARSPDRLGTLLVRLHLAALPSMRRLDVHAARLHAAGVPVFHDVLPSIVMQ